MFATIGHTFELMKMSWRVLMKDRELLLFPLMAGVGLLITVGIFLGLASAAGTLDRLDALTAESAATQATEAVDIVLAVLLYITAYFITIFFNAALISAALERLRGGDPNVQSGLKHALSHIHNIIGWAIIAATVGLVLRALRGRSNNTFARIILDMIGGVWEFMTFFVVPVLVSEGHSPFGAIKRSSSIVRQTWGRQITASFGFFLVYLVAVVLAIAPALLIGLVFPLGGIIVGVITVTLAIGTVQALEGIFKAALYEYAIGEKPQEFDLRTLQTAYRPAPQGA